MPREALQEEYAWVVDPNGIADEEAYLTAVRSGRPRITRGTTTPSVGYLSDVPARSAQAQPAHLRWRHASGATGGRTWEFSAIRACSLVDEVQDFSLEALRLMRALSPTADAARDPLCLVGDGHQRIYYTKIPLKAGLASTCVDGHAA